MWAALDGLVAIMLSGFFAFSDDHDTWEPRAELMFNCADLVLTYEVSQDLEGNTVPVCHNSKSYGPTPKPAPLWRSTRKRVRRLTED